MMKKTNALMLSFALVAALTASASLANANSSASNATSVAKPAVQQTSAVVSAKVIAQNKQLVLNFYKDIFNKHQLNKVEKYLVSDYKQHNPFAATGRAAFTQFFTTYIKQNPGYRVDVKRIIAQNDLVVVHSNAKNSASDRGSAVIDIFRIKNGKIVEHWDVVQPVPEKSANNNTMFYAKGTPVQVKGASAAVVAANTKLVTTFYNELFKKGNIAAIDQYLAPEYIQHNPGVATGREAIKKAFAGIMPSTNPDSNPSKTVRVIAEGDLVLLHTWVKMSPTDRGSAVVDIFRVANGKIVEHWDVVQDVPEKSANNNTMF